MAEHAEYKRTESRHDAPGQMTAIAALIGAFATLILSGPGVEVKSPPSFDPRWMLIATISGICIWAALSASRAATTRAVRLVSFGAILLSLASLILPAISYYLNFHGVPWFPLTALSGIVIIGGWLCRQRTIAVTFAAGLVAFLIPMLKPPHPGPSGLQSGDLAVTLGSARTPDCQITLKSRTGTDRAREFNLNGVRLHGQIGPSLPVKCWPTWIADPEVPQARPSKTVCYLASRAFVPSGTKSWDAWLTVPRWPSRSNAQQILYTAGQFRRISEREIGRLSSDEADATLDSLSLRVPYHDGGYSEEDYRVTDQNGDLIQFDNASMDGRTWRLIAYGWKKRPTVIKVDYFAPAALEASEIRFDFSGLRPPR